MRDELDYTASNSHKTRQALMNDERRWEWRKGEQPLNSQIVEVVQSRQEKVQGSRFKVNDQCIGMDDLNHQPQPTCHLSLTKSQMDIRRSYSSSVAWQLHGIGQLVCSLPASKTTTILLA